MNRIFTLLTFILFTLSISSQELKVKSFVLDPFDITARSSTTIRLDGNGDPCALVKVHFATSGASFSGNLRGEVAYEKGEYWVYMIDGSKNLQLRHDNFLPLDVTFADYGINSIKGEKTYVLTLVIPQDNNIKKQDLVVKVTPPNAFVIIDGDIQQLTNGQATIKLPLGNHSYNVVADGYNKQQGEVKLTSDAPGKLIIELDKKSVANNQQANVSQPTSNSVKPTKTTYIPDEVFKEAEEYYKAKNYKQAVSIYETLANDGYVLAQYKLGNCYYNGFGVSVDYKTAVKWFTKAADQGNYSAQYFLGYCYMNGKGVNKDAKRAASLYTKSANQGYSVAQYSIGRCYLVGEGVSKDETKAAEWLTKAADQGFAAAQNNLGNSYEHGMGVTKDLNKALDYYQKSAAQGDSFGIQNSKRLEEAIKQQGQADKESSPVVSTSVSQQSSMPGSVSLTFTANGVSFDMVKVQGGTFTMGATSEQGSDAFDREKPTRNVTLSSYNIGKTEVTQALWTAVMGSNPSAFKGDDLPVEKVSWEDCQTFISKLNSLTGKRFRLPTEAEWEYAARGGNRIRGNKYSGSNTIGDVAWYKGNSGNKTHPVGTKSPNELGIYDMSGNVFEWCSDWYGNYSSSSQNNPTGSTSGTRRVDRGGSCLSDAGRSRSSYRGYIQPVNRYSNLGLRLCLSE